MARYLIWIACFFSSILDNRKEVIIVLRNKRILIGISVILLSAGLAACGNSSNSSSSSSSSESSESVKKASESAASKKNSESEAAKKASKSSSLAEKESTAKKNSEAKAKKNSSSSSSSSNGKSLSDFEDALNQQISNDNAATSIIVNGTKKDPKVIVEGPNSWNGVNVNSDRWYNIEQKVNKDYDALARQCGVNDENPTFTWKSGDNSVITKD